MAISAPSVMRLGIVCPPASDPGLRKLHRAFQDVSGEIIIRIAGHRPQAVTAATAADVPPCPPVFVPATAKPHGQDTTASAQQRQAMQQPLNAVTELRGRASGDRRYLGAPPGHHAPALPPPPPGFSSGTKSGRQPPSIPPLSPPLPAPPPPFPPPPPSLPGQSEIMDMAPSHTKAHLPPPFYLLDVAHDVTILPPQKNLPPPWQPTLPPAPNEAQGQVPEAMDTNGAPLPPLTYALLTGRQ